MNIRALSASPPRRAQDRHFMQIVRGVSNAFPTSVRVGRPDGGGPLVCGMGSARLVHHVECVEWRLLVAKLDPAIRNARFGTAHSGESRPTNSTSKRQRAGSAPK